jgi:hypothetical protein
LGPLNIMLGTIGSQALTEIELLIKAVESLKPKENIFKGGCKTNCVTALFKHEELTAPQTQS